MMRVVCVLLISIFAGVASHAAMASTLKAIPACHACPAPAAKHPVRHPKAAPHEHNSKVSSVLQN